MQGHGAGAEAAARELEPRMRVAKLDTDAVPEIAARYGIRSIPTLILFQGGVEAARTAGAMPLGQLKAWLEPRSPARERSRPGQVGGALASADG